MQTTQLIAAADFCIYHNIELSFIESLQHSGLITVVVQQEKLFVEEDELPQLEKMVRLYHEMDINIEGIETITYLLQRMNDMQRQIADLNKRLSRYED
jgi:chaperone modulatory protein CbpM